MYHWPTFDGWAASKEVDPMKLPLDRFFNLVYFWATESMDQEQRDKFDARLHMPDARARRRAASGQARGPWSPEAEMSALGDLAAALGGGARVIA